MLFSLLHGHCKVSLWFRARLILFLCTIGSLGIVHLEPQNRVTLAQTIPPVTAMPTPRATNTATATVLPTPTTAPTPSSTPTVPSATATPLPSIYISEFMADPAAVSDSVGEWIELYNAGPTVVNLYGWTLADFGTDHHTITQDLLIAPGQYLVLARSSDTAVNGGVAASYRYSEITLANGSDELLLLTPGGTEVDLVAWGESRLLTIQTGLSWERIDFQHTVNWLTATVAWPGSSGDRGTPGSAYEPSLLPPTATTIGGGEATPMSPTPSPAATQWPLSAHPSSLQIDEITYNGSDEEFVALINTGPESLALTGWSIGDEETPGQGEGFYDFPAGTVLAAGKPFVIARNGTYFRQQWGRAADAEFANQDALTPDMVRRQDLAGGEWALNNSGDEVILRNPDGAVADVVVYGNGSYTPLGVAGELRAPSGYTIQRVPDAHFPTVTDQRHRFLYAPPAPFFGLTLPLAVEQEVVLLPDNLTAVWGSLGAQSTFGPEGSAPPHYLLAAAAAQGLDFLAIADPTYVQPWSIPSSIVPLPAWQWRADDGAMAIVYDGQPQTVADSTALLAYLQATGATAQWQSGDVPQAGAITALTADTVTVPDSLASLAKAWRAAGAPLLPAGNTNPPLPGAIANAPRYTGLAVTANNSAALQAALTARRGWLTNRPGLSLAMRISTADGQQWMGATIAAQNKVTVQISYGDRTGEMAALALWQDGQPIRQLDLPVGNHTWEVTIPALPDTFLYAVATQANGDFALTAPIYVLPATDGRVVLNEVLPAPWGDHNGDGAVNTDDEFIELYNPSDSPLSLAGWQLVDAATDAGAGRPVTLKTKHVINAQSWLVLFRSEIYLSLNNENEYVRLLNPTGEEVDRIDWAINPGQGASLGRLPDGTTWQINSPTPAEANLAFSKERIAPYPTKPSNQNRPNNDEEDERADDNKLPPPIQLDPRHGQAGGLPASVAQSKLSGLEADVEFYGVVTAPPGLFNATIYIADPAPDPQNGPLAGIGINVYLYRAEYPPLQEGDRVRVRGVLKSFRGELELQVFDASRIWRISAGQPLEPLPIAASEVGESLEGRLVTFRGTVSGWQGDSIFLSDPLAPDAEAVRVTVRSSTGWRRPYVNRGEVWEVTGIVSQFAWEAPWNGGYRVLVRYEEDLVKVE